VLGGRAVVYGLIFFWEYCVDVTIATGLLVGCVIVGGEMGLLEAVEG